MNLFLVIPVQIVLAPNVYCQLKSQVHLVTDTLQCSALLKMVSSVEKCYSSVGYGTVLWDMVHSPIVRYVERKHCAELEAVKLTRVRAVKGSKRGNWRGVT